MKVLKIDWLGACDCGNETHQVVTEKGSKTRLYDEDQVSCMSCGAKGVVECDGESAWVVWEGYDEPESWSYVRAVLSNFKNDINQGYTTKDKEYVVSMLEKALECKSIEDAKASEFTDLTQDDVIIVNSDLNHPYEG